MSQPSQNTNLSQALDELIDDPRLARVFSANPGETSTLYLWLLEIKQGKDTRNYQLLFSWVIPRTVGVFDRWISFNSRPTWKTEPCQFRIYRLALHQYGSTIAELVKQLCQGRTLEEACKMAGIAQPDSRFNQFRFGLTSQQIAQSFSIRPVIFLETTLSTLSILEQVRPMTSPIEYASAFVGSLFRCDKLTLFCQTSGDPLPKVDELVRICLKHLQEETGLNFENSDSQRLGNLEWLCFPAVNEHEQPQVRIDANSTSHNLSVNILPEILAPGTSILVRCRAKNSGAIILDQCKNVQINAQSETSITFEAREQIRFVTITIWIQAPQSALLELWYEHSFLMRLQLNLSLGQSGSQIHLPSEWLEKIKSRRLQEQIEQAQYFHQVNYEQIQIGGNNQDSWVHPAQMMQSFARKLFPPKSQGAFFQTGWQEAESGQLSFFQWLQALTNDPTASKVLIVDPYFDSPGILEVIARISAVQAEYVVLTTTQIQSDDDVETENSSSEDAIQYLEPQRASRLKTACEQLQVLIRNLKFRLLDVRSTEGGKKQIFHDRYILVFDQQDEIKAGYHLSNSIQGATKVYPLLITPIQAAELPFVEEYVSTELLHPSNPKREVQTLFSSIPEPVISPIEQHLMGINAVPYANLFFAVLLQDSSLRQVELFELVDRLATEGLYNLSRQEFEVHESALEQIDTLLDQFAQTLQQTSGDSFTQLWSGLGGWLDQSSDYEHYLTRIVSASTALAQKLHEFLSNTPANLDISNHSNHPYAQANVLQLCRFMKQDFVSAVQDADRLLKLADCNVLQLFLEKKGIRYAVQALIMLEPGKVVTLLEEFDQFLMKEPFPLNSSSFWCSGYTISFTLQQLLDQLNIRRFHNQRSSSLLEKMMGSSVASIRAIAGYSLSPLVFAQDDSVKPDLQAIFDELTQLTEIERTHVLAEWIFHLRIRANNAGETETLRSLRLAIFNEIRRSFPSNITLAEVSKINKRLSGPTQGTWARTTTEDLFLPLIQDSKLIQDQILEMWCSVLIDALNQDRFGTPNHNKKAVSKTPHFVLDMATGSELIDVCAGLLVLATPVCRREQLTRILELRQTAQRLIHQPFLRSRNYQDWHSASVRLLWLQGLLHLSAQYRNDEEIEDLQQSIAQLEEVLVATYEAERLTDKKPLWDFVANFRMSDQQSSTEQ